MWFLYLDESGDLGFDFVNKKPSKFFTISILAISSRENERKLTKAVKVTLRRKLRSKNELKATKSSLDIKKYFYDKIKDLKFGLYSVTLNKRKIFERLTNEKEHFYNFIARQVLDKIPFEKNQGDRVYLILDKCKSKPEIEEFNVYIRSQLQGKLNPRVPLEIFHWPSHESHGLQAADLFSWGIFQKYERKKTDWMDVYKDKIRLDEQYL